MAKREPEETGCENCRFWREQTEAGDEIRWGHCHRNPPQIVATVGDGGEDMVDSALPWVALPMFCGEHKPRLQ